MGLPEPGPHRHGRQSMVALGLSGSVHSLSPRLIKLLIACGMASIQPHSPDSGIPGCVTGQCLESFSVWLLGLPCLRAVTDSVTKMEQL